MDCFKRQAGQGKQHRVLTQNGIGLPPGAVDDDKRLAHRDIPLYALHRYGLQGSGRTRSRRHRLAGKQQNGRVTRYGPILGREVCGGDDLGVKQAFSNPSRRIQMVTRLGRVLQDAYRGGVVDGFDDS